MIKQAKKLLLVTSMAILAGCSGDSGNDANTSVTIRFAGVAPEGHPGTVQQRKFAEVLEEISEGQMTVQVFPNNQLGTPDTFIDSTRRGNIEMFTAGTELAAYEPKVALFEAPYLFNNLDEAQRSAEGETGEMILDGLVEKTGLRGLDFYPHGYRHFSTRQSVQSFEDYSGLRIRMPNIDLYMNLAAAVGMSGQAMAFTEVYSGLEQGVVDGSCNALITMKNLGMEKMTPYIQRSGHIAIIHGNFINEDFYQGLTEEQQGWIMEASAKATDYTWNLVKTQEEELLTEFSEMAGVEVVELDEAFMGQMVDAGRSTYQAFYDAMPEAEAIFQSVEQYRD